MLNKVGKIALKILVLTINAAVLIFYLVLKVKNNVEILTIRQTTVIFIIQILVHYCKMLTIKKIH